MKIDLTKVKCVITDFDLTLYSNANMDFTEDYYLDYLENMGFIENRNILREIKTNHPEWHNLQATMHYLKGKGKSTDDFLDYMGKHPYNIISDGIETASPKIVKKLSELYPVYLLSDSAPGYILHYLKLFKFNPKWFAACVSNDFKSEDMAKSNFMKKIIKDTGLKPQEILMVGDSEDHDIAPAEKLKMQTFHVKDIHDTEEIFERLIKLKEAK